MQYASYSLSAVISCLQTKSFQTLTKFLWLKPHVTFNLIVIFLIFVTIYRSYTVLLVMGHFLCNCEYA